MADLLQSAREILLLPKDELQRSIWIGKFSSCEVSAELRGLCWRLVLGILDYNNDSDLTTWGVEIENYISTYADLKAGAMPNMEAVKVDPLTALADSESNEWKLYYKVFIPPCSMSMNCSDIDVNLP
jgi:hypothetical protein